MKMTVLAVRDRCADVFAQPMFVMSLGSAVRSFGDEINRADPNNQFNKHPEDFDLWHLGFWDDNTGIFEFLTDGFRQVALGRDLVRS